MPGQCPKCNAPISSLKGESVVADFGHASFHSIFLKCPSCNLILGTQIDPTLIREETVRRITTDTADRIKGGKGTEPPPGQQPQQQG